MKKAKATKGNIAQTLKRQMSYTGERGEKKLLQLQKLQREHMPSLKDWTTL